MIITQKKPPEELLAMLEGVKKVAIVGCGSCAAVCPQGIDIPGTLAALSAMFDSAF